MNCRLNLSFIFWCYRCNFAIASMSKVPEAILGFGFRDFILNAIEAIKDFLSELFFRGE